MSHSVTVTTHRSTTTTSAIILNTGFCTTFPGILKAVELALNIACVGILAYYIDNYGTTSREELFFLLIAVTFLIGTFINLLSCLLSIGTASILSKTIYEYLYHGFAFLLYLSAGISLLIYVNKDNYYYRRGGKQQNAYIAAAVMGLVNAALYLISTILAYRSYHRG